MLLLIVFGIYVAAYKGAVWYEKLKQKRLDKKRRWYVNMEGRLVGIVHEQENIYH